MGGCRCTYRNCTVKTDGKTHMFHYPVFEKIRCHQWLVNAHRFDFLNLKVSQLKNRVVCQYHFKDENFMNYKRDKLTFDAIPTENGPFCDASTYVDPSKDFTKSYTNLILLEDIENEVIFNDKKANFNMKYVDFLTNNEHSDSIIKYSSNNVNLSKENSRINLNSNVLNSNKGIRKIKVVPLNHHFTSFTLPTKPIEKIKDHQRMLIVPPYTEPSQKTTTCKDVNQEQDPMIYQTNDSRECRSLIKTNNESPDIKEVVVKREPRVKILSQEKIEGVIPVIGRLEKVSPSETISIPNKRRQNSRIKKLKEPVAPSKDVKVQEVLEIEYQPTEKSEEMVPVIVERQTEAINGSSISQLQSKTPKGKSKLTAERTAAIEQKRKFNMRMKDILETCLEKLDEPEKIKEKTPSPIQKPSESLIKQPDLQVTAHLAKEEKLPNVQEYTIAYLDERMKSMERLLLNKIEQNSQKIVELADTFTNKTKNECIKKKNVVAQTHDNEDQYKKFLFQEISKYISQDSKSLIYEELFINKFALTVDSVPQRKKRRKCI